MADPAFRSVHALETGSSATITLNAPSGMAEGDLLVANLWFYDARSVSSPPSGWTERFTQTDGKGYKEALYTKIAGASEPSSWDWTLDASASWGGRAAAFTGVQAYDTKNEDTSTASTTCDNAGVTTSADASLLVFFVAADSSGVSHSAWTSPFAEIFDQYGAAMGWAVQASAGASGTIQTTASASVDTVNVVLAFTPASGATYDETGRLATVTAVVGLSDLQTFSEAGLSAAGVVLVSLDDVAHLRELGLAVPVSAIVAAAEAQAYQEALDVAVASGVTVQDILTGSEALSVSAAAVIEAAVAQTYREAGLQVTAQAQAAIEEFQTYAEGLSLTVGAVVSLADALGSGEDLALVAVASAQVSDLQAYLEASLGAAAEAQLSAADVQAYRETLAAVAVGPISLQEAQAYLEMGLLSTAVATVGIADALAAARSGVPRFVGSAAASWARIGSAAASASRIGASPRGGGRIGGK